MDDTKDPAIGISYQCELPGKRQVVLQSFVPRDCDIKDLNAVLDKMQAASDRQFAIEMRDILNRELEQQQKLAEDHAARMAQVDENIKVEWARGNKRGDPVLDKRQRQEQLQAYANAEESKKRIVKVREQIAANEAKIGA